MKSAVYQGGNIRVAIVDIDKPEPGDDEILVKIVSCGICGTDVHMTAGGAQSFAVGRHFGHEFAGIVSAKGSGVTEFNIGDKVAPLPQAGCGECAGCLAGEPYWCVGERPKRWGGFANYAAVKAQFAAKVPEGVTFDDAALTEPLAVGLHGVERAGPIQDKTVLCIGAGAIGLSALYWAKRLGAKAVIACARSSRAKKLACELGADEFADLSKSSLDDYLRTKGAAPDIVLECSGATGMIAASIDAVRPRGQVVVLGYCAREDTLIPSKAVDKEIDLKFSIVYAKRHFEFCLDAMKDPEFKPKKMITGSVLLDQLPHALEELRGGNDHCKIIVHCSGDAS